MAPTEHMYDEAKFRELVLFVASELADDETFGATKLNKVLFFSDFIAYAEMGHPITGATYQKLPHGPAPRRLIPVVEQLAEEGAAEWYQRHYLGQTQKRLIAKRGADMSRFAKEEQLLVLRIANLLRGHTATQVSQLSHDASVGWQFAEVGEDIPYYTAFLANPQPPTEQEVERGREIARDRGELVLN